MHLLLIALLAATPLAAIAATPVLTPDGYGPLKIGMTRRQVITAYGPRRDPAMVGSADIDACDQFRPRRAPAGMLVMIERNRLTRISLVSPTALRTSDGLAIGNRRSTVIAKLGSRGQVTPHTYSDPPAVYIDHWRGKPGASRGIRYEIGTDARVEIIHAGGTSIQYVEGCL